MAWKRSSVRSRPGPPCFQQLTDLPTDRLVAFGSQIPKTFLEISVNFFPLRSEFSIDRVDGCLHALRDFLHIHVGRCGRTGMPEKSLNVLHRSLLLRQRRKYRRRGSTSYSPSTTLEPTTQLRIFNDPGNFTRAGTLSILSPAGHNSLDMRTVGSLCPEPLLRPHPKRHDRSNQQYQN